MKILLIFALALPIFGLAQTDTLPPYKQVPVIPAFTIQKTDSSWFGKKDLPKKTPVVIVYFNPECGHCQHEAEELTKQMDKFKKVFFVWAAFHDMNSIQEFTSKYGFDQYKNIVVGKDSKYFLPVFYQVKMTPFSAVYDKNGNFVKAFETGMTPEELEKALNL